MTMRFSLLSLFAFNLFAFDDGGDYHLHLGGSVSKEYLLSLAQEDSRDDLQQNLNDPNLTIELFSVSHQLLNSPERIYWATLDVIYNSTANYLEIRTGLRDFNNGNNYQPYLDYFLRALRHAKKPVKGFLSIDRFKHNQDYINFVINAAKNNPDVILGIDISGFIPNAPRKLVGNRLANTIETILKQSLVLTIHLGEVDTYEEHADSKTVLGALKRLLEQNPTYHEYIRLGHVIFLDEEHTNILLSLKLTCEFCPSSFKFLTRNIEYDFNNHPIRKAHDAGAKIMLGTDDTLIFGTTFEKEKIITKMIVDKFQ